MIVFPYVEFLGLAEDRVFRPMIPVTFKILGAGGNVFQIYKSPIELEHIIEKRGFRSIKWKSIVYFAESGSTFLLGQNGFLNKFKVVLNGQNKEVEIVQ